MKLVKAAKDAPAYPMPLAVVRSIPRPDKAHAYDVEEMPVRLWIDSLEAGEDGKPMVRADVGGVMPQVRGRANPKPYTLPSGIEGAGP